MFVPFELRPALDLGNGAVSKITAVAAHGAKLFVGHSDGRLALYTINDPFASNVRAQLKEESIVAKGKPIEKLGVLPDADIVVALCDGIISLYDLDGEVCQTFEGIDFVKI